ncbi:MAG TPA: FAD-binding oxidoreductase [Polyangiaceae bacterium]|nr:FAD-binding oxidoreductase [Polyangiaceae bacterium]
MNREPLATDADLVVIGAGIMGLATAYHVARLAPRLRICVIEGSYLCSGASGRNGGGVRAQWADELSIRLMRESLESFRTFAREHRINTWFRQGGYLFLARSPERAAELEHSVQLQNRLGLQTRLLAAEDIHEVVPELATAGVLVASYNPEDAVVFPWPLVWGYAESARARGVQIATFTRAVGLELTRSRVSAVHTARGTIRTSRVVVAAGAHSPIIGRWAGVELPTRPQRHEICASEPLKPFLNPLVADLTDGLYFSQSTRGELVGGISDIGENRTQSSSSEFLVHYAKALVDRCPILGQVRVLRQWAGLYDISADGGPLVGEVDSAPGLYLASGFMGHGFMMAPVIGQRLAFAITSDSPPPELAAWNIRRFEQGQRFEGGMVIG